MDKMEKVQKSTKKLNYPLDKTPEKGYNMRVAVKRASIVLTESEREKNNFKKIKKSA